MSIKIQLDEHTVEDYEAIKILKELGFTDEEIKQNMTNKRSVTENDKKGTKRNC